MPHRDHALPSSRYIGLTWARLCSDNDESTSTQASPTTNTWIVERVKDDDPRGSRELVRERHPEQEGDVGEGDTEDCADERAEAELGQEDR